jgi:Lrp/AsnC family leucine-responsive transcriptional regulator
MKFAKDELEVDSIDLAILEQLQENCKLPLAAIGAKVGLTAPSVMDRIHKLEQAGVIQDYVAILDGRRLGKDVTAFIGVNVGPSREVAAVEHAIEGWPEILECHHVTGAHTLMLKIKAEDTEALEQVIDRLREIRGVTSTETTVVLSTHTERTRIPLPVPDSLPRRRRGRSAQRPRPAPAD